MPDEVINEGPVPPEQVPMSDWCHGMVDWGIKRRLSRDQMNIAQRYYNESTTIGRIVKKKIEETK